MTFAEPGAMTELAAEVRNGFRAAFGRTADVVGRAPGRVNLIGEHTDYNAGTCLPLALPHATYAAVALRSDGRVRISSQQTTGVWEGDLASLGPGAVTGWAAYVAGVVWALREAGRMIPGLEIHVDSRVPLGSGLSSSAALECSVAVAVCGLLGDDLTADVRRSLVPVCVRAETEAVGAPTGGMDQTISLLAEPDTALLLDFEAHTSAPVALPLTEHGLALLVTDTRVSHSLAEDDGDGYAGRRRDCQAAAVALGVSSLRDAQLAAVEQLADDRLRRRARHIVTEIRRVDDTVNALAALDWPLVGRLLSQSHASMRDDFEISTPELDMAVDVARDAGALGARMTGGGFGGSSVALVPADRVTEIAAAVDLAFDRAGHTPPVHLVAEPSAGARLVS